MKFVVLLAVAAVALPAPSLVWAQSQPDAQPSAKALALSRQYVELMDMPKLLDSTMLDMVPQMLAKMPEASASAPGVADALATSTRESVADVLPKMLDRVAVEYTRIFSEDELQALVDFYGSPQGKAIVGKLPEATPAMSAALADLMPEMQADMAKRFCAKMKCDAKRTPRTAV